MKREERIKNKKILLIGFVLGIITFTAYITVSFVTSSNVLDDTKIIKNGILLGIFIDAVSTFCLFWASK